MPGPYIFRRARRNLYGPGVRNSAPLAPNRSSNRNSDSSRHGTHHVVAHYHGIRGHHHYTIIAVMAIMTVSVIIAIG
eukprot:1373246-Lingulodinium_polyedra.AAC.1